MKIFLDAILYVISDPFFWHAMGLTTIAGIFIGATVYDGSTSQVKKGAITVGFYTLLIMIVDMARIIPKIPLALPENQYQTLAGVTTILIVTVFYLSGMIFGVVITKKVHHKVTDLEDFVTENVLKLPKQKERSKVKKT